MISFIVLGLLCSAPLQAQDSPPPPYLDENLPPESRAAEILSRLTTEEKISLLQYKQPAIPRLGMTAYTWWNEALHGVARNGFATVFPQAIAMAASWNPELIRREGEAVATEARVKYDKALTDKGFTDTYEGLTFWSPNINIFRDPRWGRGQETYGEDPFLTATIGSAYVRGLQGDDPVYLKTAATAKHFAVHSGPEYSRHSFDAAAPARDFRETYLPAFEHLVRTARVEGVMCAYNSIGEEPCCANDGLLTGILRNEWKFRGHVVSDCWAISDMINGHKTYPGEKDAAAAALRAGCDLSCGPEMGAITDALREGLVAMSDIDSAVYRLILTRVKLGMFSDPSVRPWLRTDSSRLCSAEHDSLAALVATESMVLLRNAGGILPLPRAIGRIGVAGAIATDTLVLLGNYNGTPVSPSTFLRGIREILPPEADLIHTNGYIKPWDASWDDETSAHLTTLALSELSEIDTVIVIAGISAALEGEDGDTRDRIGGFHRGDRTTLDLPSDQKRLIRSLREAGKKIILVVASGSAISLADEAEMVDAIVQAWYPGQRGGTALARLLFGLASPSGRLPVTVYKSVDDLPDFENYSMEGRTYRYYGGDPLYAFGFGLSYTSFQYDDLHTAGGDVSAGDTVRLSVRVTNAGNVDSREVVQAYFNKPGDERTNRSLCAFAKVFIPAGQTVDVQLSVSPEHLRSFDESTDSMRIRPGRYRLGIGRSSGDIRLETDFSVH
ncbi:MAG TPA: glycoside hydrolase family 3 C-terminal domain-containing protein [Bacteroidota bacterium]|nr:glycoside hydrolase family 3 C-terminal domain-containing protein [Bacteroidota bacterium]